VEGGRLAARNQRTSFLRRTHSPAPIRVHAFSAGRDARLYDRPEARRHRGNARMRPLITYRRLPRRSLAKAGPQIFFQTGEGAFQGGVVLPVGLIDRTSNIQH